MHKIYDDRVVFMLPHQMRQSTWNLAGEAVHVGVTYMHMHMHMCIASHPMIQLHSIHLMSQNVRVADINLQTHNK